jgi:hypothetical protein
MLVHENALVKIGNDMPLDRAALIGCGVTTGVGAVLNTARIEPGSTVAVFGCGGVGLAAIQGARIAGARMIIAVDQFESKLALARRLGATHTVDASHTDAVKAIRELASPGQPSEPVVAGLGFGKEAPHDLEVMHRFSELRSFGLAILLATQASPPGRRCPLEGRSVEKVQPSIDLEFDPADHPRRQIEKGGHEHPDDRPDDRVEDGAEDDRAEAEEHPQGAHATLPGRQPGTSVAPLSSSRRPARRPDTPAWPAAC